MTTVYKGVGFKQGIKHSPIFPSTVAINDYIFVIKFGSDFGTGKGQNIESLKQLPMSKQTYY